MSDNSKTVAGYWLPATITAERIEDACAALGYEIASEATGEEPAATLMRILMAMGQPVVFTGNASDHGIKITTNESGEQRIWQLFFRDEMEAQAARVAAEKDAEIAELKRLIQIIAFPVKNDIGTEWSGSPPIYAERDGLHMVRDRRTGYLKIIRWYIQWDGRGQVCSMSEDDSMRLYDRYIGPVFCAALNEGAAS